MLASTLARSATSILSADIPLDTAEPLIGSFTVDGLTYSVDPDGLTLVAVDVSAVAEDGSIAIPTTVTYADMEYPITAIAPYAFYLSGVTQVELPAAVSSVDDRAFRSSDVERVSVAAGNSNYASFDGALYSANKSRLLLIPEGRKGSVLLSCETEVAEPSLFSHCSLVDAISVEEGGAAFSSWDGLLYTADGTTLLRVPAGATEITIRDGCTTIATGAMEGCASLERIHAPASVTSISPDVFTSVPTVSLPASAVAGSSDEAEGEAEVAPRRVVAESQGLEAPDVLPDLGSTSASSSSEAAGSAGTQLTAMVALSSTDADLPKADPAAISVVAPDRAESQQWGLLGFRIEMDAAEPSQSITPYAVDYEHIYLRIQSEEVLFGRFTATGEYVNQNPFAIENGWFAGEHGLDEACGLFCEVRFDPDRGWYLCRINGTIHSDFEIWPQTKATSMSLTPTGPALAQGALVGPDDIVYFRTENTIGWNPNGGVVNGGSEPYYTFHGTGATTTGPTPSRPGFSFLGWYTEPKGGERVCGAEGQAATVTTHADYYAHWGLDLSFDVDSEPQDEDYVSEPKDDQTVDTDSSEIEIADPKRPGYVFEGWAIPSADGTEAVDQDLVYQGEDGKWYVDASKLPDYANGDGRVELTARWTSVISVDVPQSVTFYADTVTQNQGSREGAASSAFGQNKVANQSEVDLRVVGLESSAVKTTDVTLGADSILKKAEAAPPASSAGKLLSLYPSAKQWTADELQDPDAVGGTKDAAAVDFDLDDILLEKSFPTDSFTIPAGDTLNMGYRLNLSETGQQLDYDKLSTLEDGQSAALANISYCFASEGHPPSATGSTSDAFYIEYGGKVYGPKDIKDSAECIAELGTLSPCYELYHSFLTSGMDPSDASDAHSYVKWGDGVTYSVRIIGINHDDKSDGTGKAGLTFQFVNLLNTTYQMCSDSTKSGWEKSSLRSNMNGDTGSIWKQVPTSLADRLCTVRKLTHNGTGADKNEVVTVTNDKLFILSYRETTGGSGSTKESHQHALYPWLTEEGNQYEYWVGKVPLPGDFTNPDPPKDINPLMKKGSQKAPAMMQNYWLRTMAPTRSNAWVTVNQGGGMFSGPGDGGLSTRSWSTPPAFCL